MRSQFLYLEESENKSQQLKVFLAIQHKSVICYILFLIDSGHLINPAAGRRHTVAPHVPNETCL
jgi:hypothetical protein